MSGAGSWVQCSHVPHRVLFSANPQLRIHESTLGETLLGVGCSGLRLADPVLLEDHHVSPALELCAEKHGVERDLVAGNPDDAQLVEERLAVYFVAGRRKPSKGIWLRRILLTQRGCAFLCREKTDWDEIV